MFKKNLQICKQNKCIIVWGFLPNNISQYHIRKKFGDCGQIYSKEEYTKFVLISDLQIYSPWSPLNSRKQPKRKFRNYADSAKKDVMIFSFLLKERVK